MRTSTWFRADAIAVDRDDRPQLITDLQESVVPFPYAMFVTLKDTHVFEWDGPTLSEILHLPTADILSPYHAEFPHKRVSGDLLTVLIEGWLRDVAFQWNLETPPFLEALSRTGLAQRIERGTTENTRHAEDY